MRATLIFLGLLLGNGLIAKAQVAALNDPCRYYVGLQSATNWYELYYKAGPFTTPPTSIKVSPWLLSAGYFILPRLAVQLGFAYRTRSDSYPGATGTDLQGHRILDDAFTDADKQVAVPLMLRYSLSRRKPHLRADALLGVVWAHHSFVQDSHDEVDGQITRQSSSSDRAGNFYASAGLGVRWVFNRHFEALGDFTLNRNLKDVPNYVHQQVTGNTLGLTHSVNLGLRYRFNLHKPAPIAAATP